MNKKEKAWINKNNHETFHKILKNITNIIMLVKQTRETTKKEETVAVPWQFLSEKLIFELIFFSNTKIKFSFYMEIFAM